MGLTRLSVWQLLAAAAVAFTLVNRKWLKLHVFLTQVAEAACTLMAEAACSLNASG
jgi:hypothetical protein